MSPDQEAKERAMWHNALVFYNTTGVMDLSYNGYFFHNDLSAIANLTRYTQPNYVLMDIECMPSLDAYVAVGYKSSNFDPMRQPGESDSAAALRLGQRWNGMAATTVAGTVAGAVPLLYAVSARYDNGMQSIAWPAAAKAGLQDSPSYYSLM